MRLLAQVKSSKFVPFVIALILTIYQLSRVIAFINVYGGLEHDSGWFLGVSRSLAEQGTYTSMVSTLNDPAAIGGIDIDQKFNLQAPDGRIWFFTGNGTGPASIVPNALILKIFGTGFWTLRAGPLIFYTLFLVITAYALFQTAGLGAVVLFHIYLFCYPRLSIFLSYEAEGEVAAMVYLVLAYLLFALALSRQKRRLSFFFVAGLVAGLAFNTKLLALLSVSGIVIWAGWLWVSRQNQIKIRELMGLGLGMILPQTVWEIIHLVILVRLTNFELYLHHTQQRLRFVLDDGSGIGLQVHSGAEFGWRKFFMLEEVAHPEQWVTQLVFAGLVLGGVFLIWRWQGAAPYKQNLVAPIWLGWLVNTIWFVSLAKTGWPRHFWFGLILATMLLCIIPISLIQSWPEEANPVERKIRRGGTTLIGMLFLLLIGWGFSIQPHVWGFFLPAEIVPYWLEKRFDYIDMSALPWILVPRADQNAVVDYINRMPSEANVYYPTAEFGHKAAEIPTLTGRINYPIKRRAYPGVKPHPADILLIPPSILSIWRYAPVTRQELLGMVLQACPQPVLQNDNYIICLADQVQLPK